MASAPGSRALSVSSFPPLIQSPPPATAPPPPPPPPPLLPPAASPAVTAATRATTAFAAMTDKPTTFTRQAAIALTGIVLIVSAVFGSTTLSRLASLLLAAPIVFILCLLTLATSNIVFSVLYSRRQQQQQLQQQTSVGKATRDQPGQAHRHAFHYLRPAYFSRPVAWAGIERRRKQEQAAKYRTPIADTMPQLSEAIDTVIELIMRDYIAGWMRAITPEVVIQQRIEELLRVVLIRLKLRVVDLDLTQLVVTHLVPKITSHVNDFRKAEMTLRGDRLERKLTASDELDLLVARKFRNGKLHRAISTSTSTAASEEAYLRVIVQAILPTLIPANEAHSHVLSTLLREILVGAVLRPVMELLSDPDYWNQNVDLYAGKAIREQNMVKKLREALKQHADSLDYDPKALAASSGDAVSEIRDMHGKGDLHSFEDFLKMIKRCDSLLDVKRIRNTIMIQIRKKKALIAGRERDEIVNGSKVEDIIVYINRLDIAKRRAEKRIEALGGPAYPKRRTKDYTPSIRGASSAINLEVVLANPTGLSYFMEFQDRRNIMDELQFWLLIESLNIKAETQDASDASMDSQSHKSKESVEAPAPYTVVALPPTPSTVSSAKEGQNREKAPSIMTTTETSDTLREDVRMIYEMYFAEGAPRRVRVDPKVVETVRIYGFASSSSDQSTPVGSASTPMTNALDQQTPSVSQEPSAETVKQYLLQAQKQVYDLMLTRDYPEFAKSDLYYKFVTSYQALLAEDKEGHEGHEHDHSEPTTPILPRPPQQPSSSQHPHRSSLLSALNLGSPERHRESRPSEPASKRSSTGSFLEIFGIGREKDKDRERERGKGGHLDNHGSNPLRRPLSLAAPAPSSSADHSRTVSNNSSMSSLKLESERLSSGEKGNPSQHDIQPAPIQPVSLSRSRSMGSLKGIDMSDKPRIHAERTQKGKESSHRKSISSFEASQSNTGQSPAPAQRSVSDSVLHGADSGDEHDATTRGDKNGASTLGDSLLLELERHGTKLSTDGDDEDDVAARLAKAANRKPSVIDAVEAALSSILQIDDQQQKGKQGPQTMVDQRGQDPSNPAFATAPEDSQLLHWGSARSKRKKKALRIVTPDDEARSKAAQELEPTTEPVAGPSKPSKTDDRVIRIKDHPRSSLTASLDLYNQHQQQEHQQGSNTANIRESGSQDSPTPASPGPFSATEAEDDGDSDTDSDNMARRRSEETVQDNVHLAAPGDLMLAARIQKLAQGIENVKKQEQIVETLIQKAERQGRQNELRILKKSKSALRREILSMEYQKTQYEVQEEENMIMPGRSTLSITSSTVGYDGSKEFALYVIEVHQMAQDGSFASGWVIARRYSEFFALHQILKEKFPIVKQFELPGKRGFLKLQKSFVESRRIGLERYLRSLIRHADICQSQELRSFLSQENVALPQFSSSSTLTPSLFGGNDSRSESVSNDPSPRRAHTRSLTQSHSSPFSFEQLFHSNPLTTSTNNPTKEPAHRGSDSVSRGVSLELDRPRPDEDPESGFMKHIYQTVSEGLDDMFSGGPPTVLGNITKQLGNQMMQFSLESDNTNDGGQNRNKAPNRRSHDGGTTASSSTLGFNGPAVTTRPTTLGRQRSLTDSRVYPPTKLEEQISAQTHILPVMTVASISGIGADGHGGTIVETTNSMGHPTLTVVEPEGVTTFTEPLCDLFIELFELKEKNNWLRRQAVVIILQQVLGGTIERKLRDTIKTYVEESMLSFYVLKLRDALWPPVTPPPAPFDTAVMVEEGFEMVGSDGSLGGFASTTTSPANGAPQMAKPKVPRTAEQKAFTRDQANRKLSAFLPDLLGNMVGHQNARRGARRLFAAFQNRRLNQQLVYTALDEVVAALWPELVQSVDQCGIHLKQPSSAETPSA